MESLNPQVVAAVKLPILNPNEFDLWKMRIEQIINGVVQSIAPTTAEQKLAKKNELKAIGTLLMALPDNLPSERKTHTLIWRNKSDLEEQSLDDLFNILKIYKAEVKGSSTSSQYTQNIAFVSSNNTDISNKSVSVVPIVSAASSKALVFTILNVDSLSDVVIYSFFTSQSNSPQLENEDLKQIDADDLEETDLKWQVVMLTTRAMRFLQRTERNLCANGTAAIRFDMSIVECYNYHRRGYFVRECRSPRDNNNKEAPRRTIPVEVSTLNSLVHQALQDLIMRQVFDYEELHSDESVDSVSTSPVNDRYKSGEGYHAVSPPYTGTFMPSKPDLVFNDAPPASESIAHVVNVESSSNKPSKDMSNTLRPDASIIKDWTSDSEDETEIESVTKRKEPSFIQTSEHVKTPRESVKKVEPNKQTKNFETDNQKSRVRMTHPHSNRNVVPIAVLTRSRLLSLNAARPVSTAIHQTTVKSPRPVKHVVTKKHPPIRRPINHRPTTKNSNFNKKVTTVKVNKVNVVQGVKGNADNASANWGNPHQVLKDKGFIDSGCSRHMTGNISFFQTLKKLMDDMLHLEGIQKVELKFNLFNVSQMCDKKNSVLFTDTECVVLSFDYKLPDEDHVLLRVPRENTMYNVDLKNVVPSGDLTCLFVKATLDESNLWHRSLRHINFKTMNKLFYGMKGIKREFSVARTPQQNRVIETKNKTLIETARTMLEDLLLPIPFWAEVVNAACYVQNRILVTKPHNKTPYELLLGKFNRKADEGFLIRYYVNSKAFRVFNSRTRIVQESLHINFLENQPNVAGSGPKWLFDIDTLTQSMNYQIVVAGNQPNHNAGIKESLDVGKVGKETVSAQQYVLLPLWSTGSQDPPNTDADAAFDVKENEKDVHVSPSRSDKPKKHDVKDKRDDTGKTPVDSPKGVRDLRAEFEEFSINSTNKVNAASAPVTAIWPNPTNSTNNPSKYPDDPDMPELEDIVYLDDEEDVGAEADFSNLETNISVSPIPTTRVYKDHPVTQIIGDLTSAPQTRSMARIVKEQGGLNQINNEDFHTCMFACFLSQEEPKRVHQALKDPSWIEAMQEELL
uniref:Retroviral polymerase SH3-like domain-containing protein n=1 Tax=Tanacetum cinerariifolium TaxID=118510 RepID=A0A6L2KVZ8_TANCI|nr:hypothetical protein [Tanacetum cinerariifolium]